MNDQAAAAYLNLTPRTLRNYRRQGKLPYREVKGKTRPVIAYEQRDLDHLKAELEKKRRRSKKPGAVKPPLPRITFSLGTTEHEELCAEARKQDQAPGDYARRLVRERTESQARAETAELREELARANAEIQKIRKEFSLAFEVVLEMGGLPADQAKQWVTDNLR